MNECYDVSIIIPVKRRRKNTKFVIPYLSNLVRCALIKVSLTLVEYDSAPQYRSLCEEYNINYVFIPQLEKRFWKALIQNIGALLNQKTNYYLFYDVDCIVPSDFFLKLENYMDVSVLQPYSGKRLFSVSLDLSNKIRSGKFDLSELSTFTPGVEPDNPGSTGGLIMVRKDVFEKVGGYDPELFWDYSPEDNFFFEKCKHVSEITFADDVDVYHLYHKSLRGMNPFNHTMDLFFEYFKKYEDKGSYISDTI